MTRPAASKLVVGLLSLNAAALILIFCVAISRGELISSAVAQTPPDAPRQDLIVMPGQLATNVWGCYVLDTRTQTLCVYQYNPGEKLLRLQAARGFEQDLQLRSFNTSPLPAEIAELVQKERMLQSGTPTTAPAH